MKIATVEVIGVGNELTGEHTFVRLTTDTGITGLGQSGGWGYPKGVAGVLDELTLPARSGPTPSGSSTSGTSSYRARPFRGNLLSAAVSAIDLALWDIKGKALDLPVWELLGGRTRDRVRLHALVGGGTPDEIGLVGQLGGRRGLHGREVRPARARLRGSAGGQARQLGLRRWPLAAREAGGDEVDLIFELHRKLDPTKAIVSATPSRSSTRSSSRTRSRSTRSRRRRRSASASRRRSRMGERLSSIWEFERAAVASTSRSSSAPTWVSRAACPGAARSRRSPRRTTAGSRRTTSSAPGSTAPTLHLCVTIPNLVTMEFLPSDEDSRRSAAAFDTDVVRSGGYCEVPEAPGLGVSLVDEYADDRTGRRAPLVERRSAPVGWLGRVGQLTLARSVASPAPSRGGKSTAEAGRPDDSRAE